MKLWCLFRRGVGGWLIVSTVFYGSKPSKQRLDVSPPEGSTTMFSSVYFCHMIVLLRAACRDYGYFGPHDGWSASVAKHVAANGQKRLFSVRCAAWWGAACCMCLVLAT